MCEIEGRKREERFLLMTGTLLFFGLSVQLSFVDWEAKSCQHQKPLWSQSYVLPHLFPATPAVPLSEPSLFHAFRVKLFWVVLGHNQRSLPSRSWEEVWGTSVCPPSSSLALPLRQAGGKTHCESRALASGGGEASILPDGSGQECWSPEARVAQWCGRQQVPCSHTVSHDDTVKNGWWAEESERKRIEGTETKVRHRVRSSNSNGQPWTEAGAGDRIGLAENQGKEVNEPVGGRENRLGKHHETQGEDMTICLRKWQVFDQHIHQQCWRPNPRTPLGASSSEPQIQDRTTPGNEIYVSACSRPNYIQAARVSETLRRKERRCKQREKIRDMHICCHTPSMSWSSSRPAHGLVGDSEERRQWLPASENSHSKRRDKMYIHKAINTVILLGLLRWTQ